MWMPFSNDCTELKGYRSAAILARTSNVPGYPLLGESAKRHSLLGMPRWPSCGGLHARGQGFKSLSAHALQLHTPFEPHGTCLTSERDARVSGEETRAA